MNSLEEIRLIEYFISIVKDVYLFIIKFQNAPIFL